jgi:acyl-CoA thioesterase
MPHFLAMTANFTQDTAIAVTGEGEYRAQLAKHWWVARGPHGGYLAALILRALTARLDDASRPVRSLTIHFTRPPVEGEISISCTIERPGRRMSFVSARVMQDGKLIALALATFAAAFEGLSFEDAPMPDIGPPESGMPVAGNPQAPPFVHNFDMRWSFGDPPFSGSKHALLGGWIRLAEPEIADAPLIATYMDAWAPAVFPVATELYICPTVDLTIHFRSDFPLEGAGDGDYYVGRFTSSLARDGFFEEDGQLWAADGRLIAQSRQLALTIPFSQI